MPRANDNRPVVGTVQCDGCGQVKTLMQNQRGTKKGYLYGRCGCGADQRTGANIQRQWLREMTPRDLAEGDWIPHPLDLQEPEPAPAPVQEPDPDRGATPVGTDEPTGTEKPRRGGLVALAITAGAAALALVTN